MKNKSQLPLFHHHFETFCPNLTDFTYSLHPLHEPKVDYTWFSTCVIIRIPDIKVLNLTLKIFCKCQVYKNSRFFKTVWALFMQIKVNKGKHSIYDYLDKLS